MCYRAPALFSIITKMLCVRKMCERIRCKKGYMRIR